jgi:hypothetical protein
VLNPTAYEALVEERRRRATWLGKVAIHEDYFPLYRAPFRSFAENSESKREEKLQLAAADSGSE